MSDPRVKVDTAGTSPGATLLANRLAREIASLTETEIEALLAVLDGAQERARQSG